MGPAAQVAHLVLRFLTPLLRLLTQGSVTFFVSPPYTSAPGCLVMSPSSSLDDDAKGAQFWDPPIKGRLELVLPSNIANITSMSVLRVGRFFKQ
jgi:hypothetical protein